MKGKFYSAVKEFLAARIHYVEKRMMENTSVSMETMKNMEIREKYYRDLEERYEQYDIFLHDIRHMLRVIAALAQEGDSEKIGEIIKEMGISLGSIEQETLCGHQILNALLLERIGYAHDIGVTLDVKVKEPLYLKGIDDLDLIAIMGNLLDNAIRAEKEAERQEGITCHIAMSREGLHIVIQIENSCSRKPAEEKEAGDQTVLEPVGQKHGIGLQSVQTILGKYGGIMSDTGKPGRYFVKALIPVQKGKTGDDDGLNK